MCIILAFNLPFTSAFGGIYLDADAIVVQSFDDIRIYDLVVDKAHVLEVNNGIMASIIHITHSRT